VATVATLVALPASLVASRLVLGYHANRKALRRAWPCVAATALTAAHLGFLAHLLATHFPDA
jgi:hypothetical protein